jgi:multidrug resistance protein
VTNLSLALYLLSLGIFPLWWSNFGQVFGRRPVYIISFSIAIVFSVPSALAKSIGVLLVMRLLSSGALASVQVLGAATVADIWEPHRRGQAMSIFFMGPQLGPLVAPIIGGALANRFGWRATMWFMLALTAFFLAILLFVVPETSVVRQKLPNGPDEESASKIYWLMNASKMLFVDPFKAFLVLRYPAIVLVVYSIGLTAIYLYVLNISMEAFFGEDPYNFSPFIVGLLYIPLTVGYLIGSLLGGRWHDHVVQRGATSAGRYDESGKPILYPEDRMQENAWCAFLLAPAGLLWYGWSTDKTVFWLVPVCLSASIYTFKTDSSGPDDCKFLYRRRN